MVWIGIGVAAIGAIVVIAAMLGKGSTKDLGAVSQNWITEHRRDRDT